MNLTEPIRRVARERPRDAALVDGERVYSFAELWSAISRMAEWFRRRGIEPSERVLLWIPNGFPFLAVHLGAMAAGILSIPIKAENGPVEFEFAAGDAKPRLLVAERALLARLPDGVPRSLDWIAVDELPIDGPSFDAAPEPVPDEHPGSAIYSYVFGEGRPYAAVLTHGNHLFLGNECQPFFLIDPGDRILILLPMLHVFPMGMGVLPAFYCGATIHVGDATRPRAILETISRHGITHIPAVPQVFEQLARCHNPQKYDLRSIKHLTSGADFLPEEVHRRIESTLGVMVVQGYGMTETFPSICNPPAGVNRAGTLGIGFHSSIRFRITNGDGAEVPPGEIGEIEVSSRGSMAGYLDAPEATARLKRDGWMRSGDLGYAGADGYLRFARLQKPIVNISGNKIDPREVAATIERKEGVRSAKVSGVTTPSPTGIPDVVLKAEVQVDPGASIVERDIRAHCRTWLAPYKVPQRVELRQ